MTSLVEDADADPRPADHPPLTGQVDLATLHLLQDRFADLGQVTVCICATDGEPITVPTWGSRYSELIGNSPLGWMALKDSMKSLALDPGSDVPSICHEGLALYSTRIIADGRPVGLIMVGTRPAQPPETREAVEIAKRYAIDPDVLVTSIDRSQQHTGATPESTRQFADTLADTIATLYLQSARIQKQYTDLGTVHALSELLSGSSDLQEILDLTVKRVVDVMPVKACGIRLLNEESGELVIKAVHNLSPEYLKKGRVTLKDNPIDGAAFEGKTVYIADAPNDNRIRYPQNARSEGIVSGLCVPMTFRGRTVGVLRVYTSHRYEFSESEVSLLRSIASQAASAVINTQLYEAKTRSDHIQRQVKAAGEIQRRMMPAKPPELVGVDFGYVYSPSLLVGGDFFDFITLNETTVGVCIADVVGKGLPAALMMASVRTALRLAAQGEDDVSAAVGEVNRQMCRDTQPSEFATLVYGKVCSATRTFAYCSAGHLPPILLRGDEFIELTAGGTVIGVDPQASFDRESVTIQADDIIVMVTDGVTEAMDFHEQFYGQSRLRASLSKHRDLNACQLARQILWDVRRFVGLAEQSDDTTVVVIKVSE